MGTLSPSSFHRDRRGGVAFEFLIVAVMLFGLIGAMVESGLMMMRAGLLERGLEQTVREMRLGHVFSDDALRRRLCDAALMPTGCADRLRLAVDVFNPATLEGPAHLHRCRDDQRPPAAAVAPGTQIMLVQACLLVDPIVPAAAMAAGFAPQPDGRLAIVARGAFVREAR